MKSIAIMDSDKIILQFWSVNSVLVLADTKENARAAYNSFRYDNYDDY